MYPPLISKDTFKKVQEYSHKNRYFKRGNPRIPYFLTGKLFCGHCGTPMVSDGGVGRLGKTYNYYVCKTARKGDCDKLREDKDNLEYDVTKIVVDYLKDKRRLQSVADDLIEYHSKRTDTSVIKSLATKIANTEKEIEDTTTAYVRAVAIRNDLLQTSCEKRMQELSALVQD